MAVVLLLPVVKCVIMLGEKRLHPSQCFKETRGENPCDERWKFNSLPLYTSSPKTGFVSLYVFEVLVQV